MNTLTLDEMVIELAKTYERGPSLLNRLEDPELRTSQPRDADTGHSMPHSRPPAPLDAASWFLRITTDAIALDQDLRNSTLNRPWARAILDLPVVTAEERWSEVHSAVGLWRSTCLTVLGYQAPAVAMEHVACMECGRRSIVVRGDLGEARAWCTNPECVDEYTGKPARYSGTRMLLLTQRTS